MILAAVGTFILVENKEKKDYKIVNVLSKGSFDIYLIHMNYFIYLWVWNDVFKISNLSQSFWFPIKLIGISFFVFSISLLIGNIREQIFTFFEQKLDLKRLKCLRLK